MWSSKMRLKLVKFNHFLMIIVYITCKAPSPLFTTDTIEIGQLVPKILSSGIWRIAKTIRNKLCLEISRAYLWVQTPFAWSHHICYQLPMFSSVYIFDPSLKKQKTKTKQKMTSCWWALFFQFNVFIYLFKRERRGIIAISLKLWEVLTCYFSQNCKYVSETAEDTKSLSNCTESSVIFIFLIKD